jgi:hypothetical protein
MQTLPTDYSHQQLVDALLGEYNSFISDGEELELSFDEYKSYLEGCTHAQLVKETSCDDKYLTLSDFIYAYS